MVWCNISCLLRKKRYLTVFCTRSDFYFRLTMRLNFQSGFPMWSPLFQFGYIVYKQAISIRNNCHKGFHIGFIGFPITIAIKCQCNSFQNTLYNSVIQPVIQPVSYVGGQEALGRKIPLFRNSLESVQDLHFSLVIHIEWKKEKNNLTLTKTINRADKNSANV